MSAFDAKNFLDLEMDAPLVKRPPLPIGDYIAIIGEPTIRSWVSPKDPTKSGQAVDFQLSVDVPPDVGEQLGLTEPIVKIKDGFILDLTPGNGLDMAPGKNGGLRKYREATDLNKPGDKFNLRMLTGRMVRVKIGHREYPEGSGDLFEDPLGVAKA